MSTDASRRRNRIVGCLLGGALGDALGGPHEGGGTGDAPPKLRLSDDTQLTLATCEAIIEAGAVEPASVASAMVIWFRAGRVTGLGASTLKALRELAQGGHWALVGRKGERAAGNGAAMRIAPLAFHLDPEEPHARVTLRDVCRITHHNDEAYVGALAVVLALRAALDGSWSGGGGLLTSVAQELPDSLVRDRLYEVAARFEVDDLPALAAHFGASGYVVESVPLALAAAEQQAQFGLAEMFTALISCGGDTDTNASIAGQIVGTLVGREGLPEQLLAELPQRQLVETVASAFANASPNL